MTYSSGNPERDRLLFGAVRETIEASAGKGSFSVADVAGRLPSDFQLASEEVTGALGDIQRPAPLHQDVQTLPDGRPLPQPKLNGATPPVPEPEAPMPDESSPTIPEPQARAMVDAANRELADARYTLALASEKLKQARREFAEQIYRWQLLSQSGDSTAAREAREARELQAHLRASQEQRKLVAEGKVPPPQAKRGNSYIDRVSSYRGGADDFARGRMQTGYHHGAYPRSMQGRRLKLPSER